MVQAGALHYLRHLTPHYRQYQNHHHHCLVMGLTNSIYLDDLIKYTRLLRCDTDKDRETINGSIQYLE